MNTGEKIDYMIQCLQVAKAEYEYSVDYLTNEPERDLYSRFAAILKSNTQFLRFWLVISEPVAFSKYTKL